MIQNKMGRIAIITISTCLGIGLGLIVGTTLKQGMLAVVMGWLTGTPIGLAIAWKDRKWVAIALLLDTLVLTYVSGQWIGLGLAGLAVFLAFFVSAAVTKAVFGANNEWVALWRQIQLILNRTHGLQEIDNGKTVVPSRSGRLLGPLQIKIRPGNAIVFVKGHKPKSGCGLMVVGPGDFISGVADYASTIFDLRDKQKLFTFDAVQTADSVTISVQIEVLYSLNVQDAARQGDQPMNDTEKHMLRRMALSAFDWDTATKCVVESSLRNVIGKTQSDPLLKGQGLDRFGGHIHRHAYQALIKQGISLRSIIIIGVQKT